MTNEYKIREICGDWGLDIPRPDLIGVLIFNSRSNAELVKAILEWEDAHPNEAVPFQSTHIGEPLTLEQLREMDGKPVWVEMKIFHKLTGWAIVHVDSDMEEIRLWRKCGDWIQFAADEMEVYAYQPAHIDREAFFGEWEGEADGYADGELVYDVWKCPGCGHVEETDEPDFLPNFCPDCGMALTPKGWAMLEKRLRG